MRNQDAEYLVIKRQSLEKLEEIVCQYIKIGFAPQGGVLFVIQNGYMQAMTKKRRSPPPELYADKMEFEDTEIPDQLMN